MIMGLINIIKKIKQAIGIKPIEIKLKKIDERAVIPTYAHDGDVCMDLTAISVEYDMDKDMYIFIS
jgi:dUTPase